MSLRAQEVVIVEAVRTPIGRGHPEKGYYREVHPATLLGHAYGALLERSGVEGSAVENTIAGCAQQFGEQAFNVARNAWLQEGLPVETSAQTIDLQCGSAQQAIGLAAAQIASGVHEVVVGSGVEHMGHNSLALGQETQERYGHAHSPELLERYNLVGQGIAADMIADEYGVSREQMDELAVRSHRLAHEATKNDLFKREIAPFDVNGETVSTDQGIRPDTSAEVLAQLRPAFQPGGSITAGNSSQVSDGAAAVLLMSAAKAEELGLTPRARIVDQTSVGCDPVKMLEGPIPATERLLQRNGLAIGDIDRFEVNEAFASVVLAWEKACGPDMERVNTRGGAMALGHPLGSSGARLITTLLHTLQDEDLELGLVTMCCAGGLGTGTLIQRV
jgi:acetyl-CoA acetyltransferase family protein